ncbi:MAG: 4Fe-4S dicluster domain-containing protein [Phycisphaerae bacterium]|nr:4Fe-4S dicluster domain-containing protein [Phycisphaerae bacterium]
MIQLTIDGKKVSVEPGQTVLDAAREGNIPIPTLCSHESLIPYGACRLCIVEVRHRNKTRLLASCTLPAAEGMEVTTNSEKVIRTRRMLAELLLARCPESKAIRNIAAQLGVEKTRFGKPHLKDNSAIVGTDGCILCGMCVRVCNDILKIGALGFEGRGASRRVVTPFEKPSEVCLSCGACSFVCPTGAIEHHRIRLHKPEPIPAEFEYGMVNRKPINIPFPQAVPRVPVIDPDTCMNFRTGGCKICEDNCGVHAIDHAQQEKIEQVEVGAIIVATGFELFDSRKLGRYGYGKLDNVLHALEFERMSHASGPTGGKILTKNGQPPKAVAILHCIGSRDENTNEYCSRVCCMYSLKFAHLVKEKTNAEVYNLYIDMRAFGKGYEEFYKRILGEGVHFIRGKCAEVTSAARTPEEKGKLIVVAEDTLLGMTRRLPVDMVILSAGLIPGKDSDKLGRILGISCSQGGFFLEKHPKLAPVDAINDGIFFAGACQGPKDIPDAVAQGAAAAAGALSLIDKGKVVLEPITAEIDEKRCAGCQLCVANCPYGAIEYNKEKKISIVTEELCKGCGTCVAGCPSGAARQKNFEDVQILAEIEGILTAS